MIYRLTDAAGHIVASLDVADDVAALMQAGPGLSVWRGEAPLQIDDGRLMVVDGQIVRRPDVTDRPDPMGGENQSLTLIAEFPQ